MFRRCPYPAITRLPVLLLWMALAGCSTPDGSSYLTLDASDYHAAFDAVIDTARTHDLIASVRDRRQGVIETEPTYARSILEPWNRSTLTLDRAMESTISFQRRRARFEFAPVAFDPHRAAVDDEHDPLGLSRQALDLTRYEGELELRVWVYVERSHVPGVRRSTWSRRLTTRTSIIDPDTDQSLPSIWTPIARDPQLEQVLLRRIAQAMKIES